MLGSIAFIASFVGVVALYLGVPIVAYICGAVAFVDTILRVAYTQETDKMFWMSIVGGVVVRAKFSVFWWQGILIAFLAKGFITSLIRIFQYLNYEVKRTDEGRKRVDKIRLILDTAAMVMVIIGAISNFFGILILTYIGGVLAIINIINQAADGTTQSITILWISLMIGISMVSSTPIPWWQVTLIAICLIRGVMFAWRWIKLALKIETMNDSN